jgi:ATP-dependent DNA ligase
MAAPYSHGRQRWALRKYKPEDDGEAVIVGFEEGKSNQNEIELNVFGYTKRPGGKGGHVPNGTLGRMLVQCPKFGLLHIGSGKGLTLALRQQIWDNQEQHLGRTITYVYQAQGMLDKPRFPRFKGFRDD